MGSHSGKDTQQKSLKESFESFRSTPFVMIFLMMAGLYVLYVPFMHTLHVLHRVIHDKPTLATPFLDGFMRINDLLLVSHMIAAVPCIILGPLLFYRGLLKANPKLHRKLGTFYVYGVFYSAITVIPLAMSKANPIPQTGFTVMAVIWFTVTWFGFMAARNKNFIAHRRWMMRSYAMSFAFIHVNVTYHWIGIYDMMEPISIKVMQSMVSWMFDLFVIEIYLASTTFKGKFVGWKQWGKNLTWWAKEDRFFFWPPKKAIEAT